MTIYSDVNPNFGQSKKKEIVFDLDAINASIENILGTNQGERVFLPEFGSAINDAVFEPISETTANIILNLIIDAIDTWEPRVEIVLSESFVAPNFDRNFYDVTIRYRILGLSQEGTFNKALEVISQ